MRSRIYASIAIILLACVLLSAAPPSYGAPAPTISPYKVGEEIIDLRGENSKTYYTGNGTFQTTIFGGSIHYKDDYGNATEEWKDINLKWDGRYLDTAPYVLSVARNETFLSVTFKDKQTGDYVVIKPISTGLEKVSLPNLIVVPSNEGIRIQRQIPDETCSLTAQFKVESGGESIRISTSAADADGKPLSVEYSIKDGILTETIIPATADGKPAKYPITADPTLSVYSSTSDGYIEDSDYYYLNAWEAASGSITDDEVYSYIGQHKVGFLYHIYRGFLFFDTFSLPSNAYITSASIFVCGYEDHSDREFFINVCNGQPTYPHDPLQSGDYDKDHYSSGGGQLFSTQFVVDSYNEIELNSAGRGWINRGGQTKFALRSSFDVGGEEPTAEDEYVLIYASEYGGVWRDPYLYVEYIAPPSLSTYSCVIPTRDSITGWGSISDTGGQNAYRRGFCYKEGTTGTPTTADSTVYENGDFGCGTYLLLISGLEIGTSYRVRAYAINQAGTGYGNTVTCATVPPEIPVVDTDACTDIAATTMEGDAAITDDGGVDITRRGFAYAQDLYYALSFGSGDDLLLSSDGYSLYDVEPITIEAWVQGITDSAQAIYSSHNYEGSFPAEISLDNKSFESGNPPTGWTPNGGTWSRSSSEAYTGTYSAKVVTSSAIHNRLYQVVEEYEDYKGKTISAGVWIKSNVAGARVVIWDSDGTSASPLYSGSGDWEYLEANRGIGGSVTWLRILLYCSKSVGDGHSIYFDGAMMYDDDVVPKRDILTIGDGATGTLENELITIVCNRGWVERRIGYCTTDRGKLFDDNQHHIALVSTGTAYKVYLDGLEKTLTVGAGINDGLWGSVSPIDISFPASCTGQMDDLRIWDDTCSQTEIQANMYELNGDEDGLVGYWKLDEGTGTIAEDSTSNNNDGTIYGADWTWQGWDLTVGDYEQLDSNVGDSLYSGDVTRAGQKLPIPYGLVTSLSFKLGKVGNPTGDVTFTIRSLDDSVLASKVWGDASTLLTSPSWKEVEFDETVCVGGWVRCLVEFSGGDSSNYVVIRAEGHDLVSPGHYTRYKAGWEAYYNIEAAYILVLANIVHEEDGFGEGEYNLTIEDLTPDTWYRVRGFAENEVGIGYGDIVAAQTLDGIPAVVSVSAIDIGYYTATLAGNVIDMGGSETIAERGFQWGTGSGNYSYNWSEEGEFGIGLFSHNISGLPPGTTIYWRAFAVGVGGTDYGEEKQFDTLALVVPVVASFNATNITYDAALLHGNITDLDGCSSATERGFVYGKVSGNYTGNIHETGSFGVGNFSLNATGLDFGTIYYFRAYAVSEAGTGYGDGLNFTTETYRMPIVTSSNATDIGATYAMLHGNVTDTGGATIATRGFEWGYSSGNYSVNWTESDSFGVGAFSHNITGLVPLSEVFWRALVINPVGMNHSTEGTFFTLMPLPSAPVGLVAIPTGISSMNVTWTKGGYATYTILRIKVDKYPEDITDGEELYYGANESTSFNLTYSGIDPMDLEVYTLENRTYYIRAWSQNDQGYSLDYAQTNVGDNGELPEVIFALGLCAFALWKTSWIRLLLAVCITVWGAFAMPYDYKIAAPLIAIGIMLFITAIIHHLQSEPDQMLKEVE